MNFECPALACGSTWLVGTGLPKSKQQLLTLTRRLAGQTYILRSIELYRFILAAQLEECVK